MKINVRVKPNARYSQVTKISSFDYKVSVDAPATEGEANKRLIDILAEHFEVPRSCISILKGFKSKNKIVEIDSL